MSSGVPQFTVGGATVAGLRDGSFVMDPEFLTGSVETGGDRQANGQVRLPVQAFVVTGRQTVVLDAGLGPEPEQSLKAIADRLGMDRDDIGLFGDASLVRNLERLGVSTDSVDTMVVSHLHADHVGWLTGPDGGSLFANARLLLPRADYEHFVVQESIGMAPEGAERLRALVTSGRAELFEGELAVSPEVTAVPGPGHTPGHTVFAIKDRDERALMVGDALYCPMQLGALDVGAAHDFDAGLARRTREWIAKEAQVGGTRVVGCHFSGGGTTRLVDGHVVVE